MKTWPNECCSLAITLACLSFFVQGGGGAGMFSPKCSPGGRVAWEAAPQKPEESPLPPSALKRSVNWQRILFELSVLSFGLFMFASWFHCTWLLLRTLQYISASSSVCPKRHFIERLLTHPPPFIRGREGRKPPYECSSLLQWASPGQIYMLTWFEPQSISWRLQNVHPDLDPLLISATASKGAYLPQLRSSRLLRVTFLNFVSDYVTCPLKTFQRLPITPG